VKTSPTRTESAERLRRIVGRLGRSLRLAHIDDSLTPSQREALFTISNRGPLRLSELAANEGINPTMLSRIVSNLEAATLVTRTLDAGDARVVHLAVTERGSQLCSAIRNERTDVLLLAISELTPQQQKMLKDALPVLEELVDSLRSRDQ
jgi:DNA-binding MarR family transcriptional regulator